MQPQSSRATATVNEGVASWYTPGLVDGFGDRLLMFDNTETESLELLRFYPSLSAIAGFENALHERVRQVGRIPDHAFPLIVAVERLEGDGALALVSTHIPGKRLSVFFDRPGPRRGLNPSFVTGIVTQVVQALAVLQAKGDDIAHTALTPDRVIVTTGGRVCVVEHVLGSALVQLNLSASQLWREFGLVTIPDPSGAVRLDARTDVFQLGVIALEMLIGRRVPPQELKDRLPDLIEQWSQAMAHAGLASDRLRHWLERSLQIGDRPYATAAEAYADLRDMPAESAASAFESLTGDVDDISSRRPPVPRPTAGHELRLPAALAASSLPAFDVSEPERLAMFLPEPVAAARTPEPAVVARTPEPAAAVRIPEPAAAVRIHEAPQPEPALSPPAPSPPSPLPAPPRYTPPPIAAPASTNEARAWRTALKAPRVSPWVAAALGLVIIAEGAVIAALVLRKPGPPQAIEQPVATEALPTPIPEGEQRAPTPEPLAAAPPVRDQIPPAASRPDPITAAQVKQRSGGVQIQTHVELKVLDGEKVLGSTNDGPIIATAGTHQLELINGALGLRIRRPVTFSAGQITKLDVSLPPGRVSINAQPWGEVSIDGKVVGETPLANLSVPIGEHEFVFRHPELGERRQTVTVRADGPTRVSSSFER